MKQESMKILFFIRKSRLKKNGEAPIFLRVTINGQLDEVRIQRSVPLKLWDNVKERSKGKDRSSTELNSYIEALKVRLYIQILVYCGAQLLYWRSFHTL